MAKKILFSFEVTAGMVLAEDLYNPSGQLVLPKGFVLDDATIAKLEYYTILEVPVDDSITPENTVTSSPNRDDSSSNEYSAKIKNSPEFKKFKADYEACTVYLNELFSDIVLKGKLIDSETLLSNIKHTIGSGKNTIQMFDYIHNLRESDNIITSHSINVAIIATILGKWLELTEAELDTLMLAAILHDIGKYTIPKDILYKPGKLTDEEFQITKEHVKKGYDILRNQPVDIRIKEACLLHHERCDGSGYPFNAAAARITPFAKIIAIADVYDAMTASRSYRGALCPFDVIQMFDEEGLHKYDPHYIMTFLNRISNTYLHNNVRLNDGRMGEIIMINQLCLYRPVVKIGDEFIDLMKNSALKIEAIV